MSTTPLCCLPLCAGEEEGSDSAAAVAAVLNGAVAGVVYRSAIAAFPDSVPFRAKFLELLSPLDFPGKAALEVRNGLNWERQKMAAVKGVGSWSTKKLCALLAPTYPPPYPTIPIPPRLVCLPWLRAAGCCV